MSEVDGGTAREDDLEFSREEFNLANAQAVVSRGFLFLDPAQDSLNASDKLLMIIRFTDIVVGPDIKAMQLRLQTVLGSHKNKRRLIALGSQLLRKLEAIEIGHCDVQEQQVWLASLDHLHGATRVIGGLHLIPFFCQSKLDQSVRKTIVINDKNVHSLSPHEQLLSFIQLKHLPSAPGQTRGGNRLPGECCFRDCITPVFPEYNACLSNVKREFYDSNAFFPDRP